MIFANENNGSGSVYCAVLYDSCILEYCVTIEKESFAMKIIIFTYLRAKITRAD